MTQQYSLVPCHARELGSDELIVVEPEHQQAHVLTGPVACAWRAVRDGDALDGYEQELAALDALGLVTAAGLSRRSLLVRGGAAVAVGAIATISLPNVAAAASSDLTTVLLSTASLAPTTGTSFNIAGLVSKVNPSDATIFTGTMTLNRATGMGTPTFVDSQVVSATGDANFTVTAGAAGVQERYSAIYAGDAHYQGSSTTADLVVTPTPAPPAAPARSTTTAFSSTVPQTHSVGGNSTFNVQVTAAAGETQFLNGTVTLFRDGTSVATESFAGMSVTQQTATFFIPEPTPGVKQYTATYSGDTYYTGSSTAAAVTSTITPI